MITRHAKNPRGEPANTAPIGGRGIVRPRRAPGEREAGFQQAVIEAAAAYHWTSYHTHDARRSQAGYPDTTLLKPPMLLFCELKVGHKRPTLEQWFWLSQLAACGSVEAYWWAPRHWEAIEQRLKDRWKCQGCYGTGQLAVSPVRWKRGHPEVARLCGRCGRIVAY